MKECVIRTILVMSIATIVMDSVIAQREVDVHSSTQLFFEDAVGRRDTLTVGWYHSSDVGVINYDASLGEEPLLGVPFDSIFEVRISDGLAYGKEIRKMSHNFYGIRFFNFPLLETCQYGYQAPILLVHSVDPPVRISWDSTFFAEDVCIFNSILLNHDIWAEFPPIEEPWETNGAFELQNVCMVENNTAELSLEPIDENLGWGDFTYDFVLNNGDTVTHGAYAILPYDYIPFLCNRLITSTENAVQTEEGHNLYPNPATDVLSIKDKDAGTVVEVLSMTGETLLSTTRKEVMIQELSPGSYLVRYISNGVTRVAKMIKL